MRRRGCGATAFAKAKLDALIERRPDEVFLGKSLLPLLVQADAHQRLTSTALAVAGYLAKHRALPANLQSLIPEFLDELPIDPFDGKPLRTVSKPGSLIIYSVGIDLEDDNGREDELQDEVNVNDYVHDWGENGDIAFCFGKAYDERRRTEDDE